MARPIKDGLDYFPLNTVLDDKFELLEAKYGIEGFAIIIKVYQLIYREHGYFYPWGEREQLLISRRVNVDNNRVNAIIMYAVEIGIFDAEMFDRGVLTSHGIQKRYIEASKRRYSLTLYQDLLLVNVDNIPVNVGKNPRCIVLNAYNNPQIERKKKGKERKEKRKESTYMRTPENPISIPKPPDPAPVPKEEPMPYVPPDNPGLQEYQMLVRNAWEEIGDKVYVCPDPVIFAMRTWREISEAVRGIHSNDVLQAIRNFGSIVNGPEGKYYWTARIGIGAWFTKHLEKFLPANFNERDFYSREYEDNHNPALEAKLAAMRAEEEARAK